MSAEEAAMQPEAEGMNPATTVSSAGRCSARACAARCGMPQLRPAAPCAWVGVRRLSAAGVVHECAATPRACLFALLWPLPLMSRPQSRRVAPAILRCGPHVLVRAARGPAAR